jgi:hypothetical protein
MSALSDHLDLFNRINIANCAMIRARQNVLDHNRFYAEYMTARLWTKYKCMITKDYSYVDYD